MKIFLQLNTSLENPATGPQDAPPKDAPKEASRRSQRANRGSRMSELIALEVQPSDESLGVNLEPRKVKGKGVLKRRAGPEEESDCEADGPNPMAPPKKRNKRGYDPKVSVPSAFAHC